MLFSTLLYSFCTPVVMHVKGDVVCEELPVYPPSFRPLGGKWIHLATLFRPRAYLCSNKRIITTYLSLLPGGAAVYNGAALVNLALNSVFHLALK